MGDGAGWMRVTDWKLLTAFWVHVLGSGPPARAEAATRSTANAAASASAGLTGPR